MIYKKKYSSKKKNIHIYIYIMIEMKNKKENVIVYYITS